MLAGAKTFIAIPGKGLEAFHNAFSAIMDEGGVAPSSLSGVGESSSRQASSPPPAPENLPDSREVHAGPKKFFFDVAHNDRGHFIRLSEVGHAHARDKGTHAHTMKPTWLPF